MKKLDKLNIQLISLNEQLKINKIATTNIEAAINSIQYKIDDIETQLMKGNETNDK